MSATMQQVTVISGKAGNKDVDWHTGITIGEAIRAAGFEVNGRQVRLNGNLTEDLDTTLETGDTIVLTGKTRGGHFNA
ncbi:MAG: hypothetical protein KDD64_08760 [Bdellovibrionales bacterium]|nr:hypothetical protein [Bdellovibrionales bacterium]